MKIVHIINSLNKGGAEGNLYRLCKFQKKKYKNKIDITILTLIDHGFYESELKNLGINIFSLKIKQKSKFLDFIKKISEFRKLIKKKNPNIIQSWMYHSNFITLLLPKIFYDKVFWNIRHSELDFKISKKMTIFLSIICGIFSRIVPKKIIYCSEKSINFHENKHFYSKKKTVLIDNGYSDKSYYPSNYMRLKFRKINKISKTDIIIGYAGRYAKQKNIPMLLFAFSKIIKKYENLYLYMVGNQINISNNELNNLIIDLNIKNKVYLLNHKKNLLQFYNGIDLIVLTSNSESFSNVLAEAMLCSTPALSTDVGCSKKIIKDCGFIIENKNQSSIIKSLKKSIDIIKNKKKRFKLLKKKSRKHIQNNFSLKKMANSYLQNWIF